MKMIIKKTHENFIDVHDHNNTMENQEISWPINE